MSVSMRIAASFNYTFGTNNVPPPGNQQVRSNQATLATVSALYIDNDTLDNTSAKADLLALVVDDEVHITSTVNPERYGKFKVTAAPIDRTDYVEISVTSVEFGQEMQNSGCTVRLVTQGDLPSVAAAYEVQIWGDNGYIDTVGKAQAEDAAVTLAALYFNAQMIRNPKQGFVCLVYDVAGGRPTAAIGWNSALIN